MKEIVQSAQGKGLKPKERVIERPKGVERGNRELYLERTSPVSFGW